MFFRKLLVLLKNALPVSGITSLAALTLLSTGIGASKILTGGKSSIIPFSFPQTQVSETVNEKGEMLPIPAGDNQVLGIIADNESSVNNLVANNPVKGKNGTNTTTTSNSNYNLASNTIPTPTPNPTPVPTAGSSSGDCIVTVFGSQYNVANLQSTHSGGNIFNCGTDMSSIYQSRHGTNVSVIASYLINSSNNSSNPTATPPANAGPTPTPRPNTPTSTPTPRPPANAGPTPTPTPGSTRCIVTVFGRQYDVTDLRRNHSGGNIFNCGTDMSSIYQSRHGTSVSLISRYLVTNSAPTPTLAPGVTPTPTPRNTPTPTPRNGGDDDD